MRRDFLSGDSFININLGEDSTVVSNSNSSRQLVVQEQQQPLLIYNKKPTNTAITNVVKMHRPRITRTGSSASSTSSGKSGDTGNFMLALEDNHNEPSKSDSIRNRPTSATSAHSDTLNSSMLSLSRTTSSGGNSSASGASGGGIRLNRNPNLNRSRSSSGSSSQSHSSQQQLQHQLSTPASVKINMNMRQTTTTGTRGTGTNGFLNSYSSPEEEDEKDNNIDDSQNCDESQSISNIFSPRDQDEENSIEHNDNLTISHNSSSLHNCLEFWTKFQRD